MISCFYPERQYTRTHIFFTILLPFGLFLGLVSYYTGVILIYSLEKKKLSYILNKMYTLYLSEIFPSSLVTTVFVLKIEFHLVQYHSKRPMVGAEGPENIPFSKPPGNAFMQRNFRNKTVHYESLFLRFLLCNFW